MKIITCYKSVPDEQDIVVNNADGSLDFSRANNKISQYDLNAIEAANQLKTQLDGIQITAMSVGGNALTNAKARKKMCYLVVLMISWWWSMSNWKLLFLIKRRQCLQQLQLSRVRSYLYVVMARQI